MENHANFPLVSGSKRTSMSCCLSPLPQPPPCTMMATGNGPSPLGTQTSSNNFSPAASPYSMSVLYVAFVGVNGGRANTLVGFQPSAPPRTFSTVMALASASVNCRAHGTRAEGLAPGPLLLNSEYRAVFSRSGSL